MRFAAPPFGRQVLGLAAGLALFGCKAKPKPAPQVTVASASASGAQVSAPPPERCHVFGTGPALVVGEVARPPLPPPEPGTDEPEEDEALLPFAARVDSALALASGFAAGGLSTERAVTQAFVALVPGDGTPGRRIALGPVHGDIDPPLVAGDEERLLVAVADMDAGGGMLRVSRLDTAAGKTRGEFSITGVDHDAGAALASGDSGALLVFGARGKHGVELEALALDRDKLAKAEDARPLKGTTDAESPVLVPRPGGYWLSFIVEQASGDAGARSDAGMADAGASEDAERLVDVASRNLLVLALDASGKAVGAPRAVTGARAHVVGFSAALLPDGALALGFREDDAAPGVESGPPVLARVGLDGAVQHAKVEDEELSAGLPSLLADPKPGGQVWVALDSASEGTRIGLLSPTGTRLEALIGDRALRGADVLAAGGGRLLVARSRGRAVELEVLECKPLP